MLVRSLFQLKKLCFKNASHFNNAFHKPTIVGSENKKIRGDKNIVSGRLTQWLIQHWMILKLSETTLKWNKLTCYRDEIGGEQKPFSWSDKLELFGASTAVYKVLLLVPKWKLRGIKWVIHAERLWKGLFRVMGDTSYKRAWWKPAWCLFMSECWGYHVKPAILNKHPSRPARLILLNCDSCEQRRANSECNVGLLLRKRIEWVR